MMRDPLLPVDPLTGAPAPGEPTPDQAADEQRALDVPIGGCAHSSTMRLGDRRVCTDCGTPR